MHYTTKNVRYVTSKVITFSREQAFKSKKCFSAWFLFIVEINSFAWMRREIRTGVWNFQRKTLFLIQISPSLNSSQMAERILKMKKFKTFNKHWSMYTDSSIKLTWNQQKRSARNHEWAVSFICIIFFCWVTVFRFERGERGQSR